MAGFATWLMGFAKTFLVWLYNHIIDLLQGALDGFCDFMLMVISLFPTGDSLPVLPAAPSGTIWDALLTTMNWLFPVAFIVQSASLVVAAILAYIVIAPLARWLKLTT